MLLRIRNQLLLSAALAVAVPAMAGSALAGEFIVDFPSNQTNGGFSIDGDDSLTITIAGSITPPSGQLGVDATGDRNTITQSGSITTTGDQATGIYVVGNANTIVNSGSISTSGTDAFGIKAGNANTITNSGAISTEGLRGRGIDAGNKNNITNSGSIATSGRFGYGIEIRNRNTVVSSGSIATIGEGAQGIYAQSENVIANSGSLSTVGEEANGIIAYEKNMITNSGTISTKGDAAHGIRVGYENTITNSGSINTKGELAHGISAGDSNTITNSGLITTIGDEADGIYGYNDNTITHAGSITTSGADAHGIHFYDFNTITSSGTITTRGSYAHGIVIGSGNTVSVSGAIFTSGAGADAIQAGYGYGYYCECQYSYTSSKNAAIPGSNNIVTISGSVLSAQGNSVRFLGSDNTLNLNAPAFLGGQIDLGTNATVNVITGRSHSILWDFSTGTIVGGDPNISGSVPWFYDPTTKKLATFDPTVLSASVDALASVSGNISGLIQGRLSGGGSGAYVPSMVSSYAEDQQSAAQSRLDAAFGEGTSTNGGGAYGNPAGWWIAGFGSQYDYSGGDTTFDTDVGYAGLAIGVDADLNANLRAGFLGGWGNASMSAQGIWGDALDTEQEGFFGSVYARARSSGFFLDAALSGGMFDVSGDRFVNDNLAYLGNSSASSDSSAWWLSPEIAAGFELAGANGWTYIPAARLRYAMQSTDGYSETGAGAGNASIDDQDIAVAEGRLEIAASRQMESVLFTGRLGWLTQWSPSDNEASVTMLGITQTVSADGGDRQAGYAGVDLTVAISDALDFTAAGEATFGGDITGGRLSAGLVARF